MRSVLHEALDTWGGERQTLKVYEEMAELQKELVKNSWGADNRQAIAEEIADVRIMLDQMCILHNCEDLAKAFRTEKLGRLYERVKEAEADAEKTSDNKASDKKQATSEWISVEERLPDSQADVLVVAYWHECWQTMIGWHSDDGKKWRVITPHGEREPGGVTHWLPLPEMPKEG